MRSSTRCARSASGTSRCHARRNGSGGPYAAHGRTGARHDSGQVRLRQARLGGRRGPRAGRGRRGRQGDRGRAEPAPVAAAPAVLPRAAGGRGRARRAARGTGRGRDPADRGGHHARRADTRLADHRALRAAGGGGGNGGRPGRPAPRHPRRIAVPRGPGRERSIAAAEFFEDYLTTALAANEVLTGIRVPKLGPGWGYRYEKFHRTAQAWAIVGVAALARRTNGQVAEARIGLANMGSVPVRARAAEAAAAGADVSREALRSAAEHADEGTSPPADLHGAADYRRHLAQVLTARALAAAAGV